MTTSEKTAIWSQSDNTAYSLWCQTIYDMLIAIGLTQTSDTGQTTTPVSTTLPSVNTFNITWNFRFNDSMQSSAPIFIKFEIGKGNGAANCILRITAGTGTNGSGSITGIVLASTQTSSTVWSPSTVNPSKFQACYNTDVGAFWAVFDTATNAVNSAMFIGRTLDGSGVPTAAGWVALMHATTSSVTFGSYEVATATMRAPIGLHPFPILVSHSQTAQAANLFDDTLYLYPPVLQVAQSVKQVGGFYGTNKAGHPPDSTMEIDQFGTARTYKSIATTGQMPCTWDYQRRDTVGPLLIWD